MPTPPLGNKLLANFGTDAEKLYNDRYRISRRWLITDENKIPSNEELQANYFEEFSTVDLTPFGDDPADIPEGYRFDDCVLIRQYTTFPPGLGFQLFVKEYETVTDTFTDTEPASKRVTDSGLSVYSQPQIGSLTAPFMGEVGVTTKVIDGVIHTLAGYDEVESGPAFKRIEVQWAEAGIISVRTPKVGGQQQVQTSALGITEAQVTAALSEVTASHKLIDVSKGSYQGFQTLNYTFEVEAFDLLSATENGFRRLTRTQLSTTAFTRSAIGTATYNVGTVEAPDNLTLTGEQIDNGNTLKKRVSEWSDTGIQSIRPVRENSFNSANGYIYTTIGLPASAMPAASLKRPDGTTALGTDITWFEPEVNNFEGFPTYTQFVLTKKIPNEGTEILVHSMDDYVEITDPGIMGTGFYYAYDESAGSAGVFPQAGSQPKTYRKKATVEVFLTTDSTLTDGEEVAYTERDTNWCSIAFTSFYFNEQAKSASGSANFRTFPNYLRFDGTLPDLLPESWDGTTQNATYSAGASNLGNYSAQANSYGKGDTTYVKEGIYRVKLDPYLKTPGGTQYYLKTVITFPAPTAP